GAGVLGANAPEPFQKNSLKQTLLWNGKDDLDEYVRDPGKMRVRVMLGLKPEFDKRLGGTSPKNLPGRVWGIAAGEMGVFVFSVGSRYYVRKFDHDGNYVMSLVPPPANLPESKLEGMGFVEYEPGQRALHCPSDIDETVSIEGNFLPYFGKQAASCRPIVVGDRLFYATKLKVAYGQENSWKINHINVDGSTSLKGCRSRALFPIGTSALSLSLAASPDGRQLYFVEHGGAYASSQMVWRGELDGDKPGAIFLGGKEPGSAEGRFNGVADVDSDAQGRLYVCDALNNRVQVFSPDGKFLKNISTGGPKSVTVHRKTGAVYLLHTARVEGKTTNRVTKYRSLDDPTPVAFVDVPSELMAMDSWASKPRVWLYGGSTPIPNTDGGRKQWGLSIWEEDGNTFKKISDFKDEAKTEDGANQIGWSGGIGDKVVCDPSREQVYFRNSIRFDLKTGALLGSVRIIADDIAFDKRGYVHLHFNPSYKQGVARLDPLRPGPGPDGVGYKECPYDYGVEKGAWRGVLPVRDQLGAKFFQDGIGVNMRGDVASESNIYYAPKFEDDSHAFMTAHINREGGVGRSSGGGDEGDGAFQRQVLEMQKRGEEVYSIRRMPGVPLIGGTIWTFAKSGELQKECAAITGDLINGVQIDEDGRIYFVCDRQKSFGGKAFLAGRGGIFGAPDAKSNRNPFTGTLMKSGGGNVRVLLPHAPTALDEKPARPPECTGETWVEGTEWLYAGASPIVYHSCSCPTMRHHTDWYKRTFVPEAYRHSIGVLDSNGNLVLHIGRYGNLDSASGSQGKIPVGGDGVAITFCRFVSGTDNYLVFEDHGERLVVLKLNYHAEQTVGISAQ
ncbi:MAG: hypothetical protein C0404_14425, partial [Verrucomicrobia bacterium]|nr:hypothetical protein [Verrucomicrobiota bacterium]